MPGLELQLHLRQQDHAKAEEARPASCALRGTFSKLNQYLHLYGELKWCLFSCVLREEQKFPLPQFLICKLFIVAGTSLVPILYHLNIVFGTFTPKE